MGSVRRGSSIAAAIGTSGSPIYLVEIFNGMALGTFRAMVIVAAIVTRPTQPTSRAPRQEVVIDSTDGGYAVIALQRRTVKEKAPTQGVGSPCRGRKPRRSRRESGILCHSIVLKTYI